MMTLAFRGNPFKKNFLSAFRLGMDMQLFTGNMLQLAIRIIMIGQINTRVIPRRLCIICAGVMRKSVDGRSGARKLSTSQNGD